MKMTMKQATNKKTVRQAFDEFLFIKNNSNLSVDTINDYKNIFSFFINFYGENSYCKDINEDTIQNYIAYLKAKPKKLNNTKKQEGITKYLSSATIATYIRHLRAVLNFFMDKGYTDRFKVKLPRVDKEVKEAYSPSELENLLKKPNLKTCSFSEYRNWVMTNYFLSTANRLATVANIKICDLNFEEEEIYLSKVKNRKRYTIPMQKELKKILIEYLSYRKGSPEDYLFCSERDDKKPLTRRSIETAIARYNLKRGVTKTSVHIYRNTFAKHWILSGGDIIRLQKILGHSNLDMVLEYVDMYGKDLQLNFNTYNPLTVYSKGDSISLKNRK
jgi:integrase/recombinase XerD